MAVAHPGVPPARLFWCKYFGVNAGSLARTPLIRAILETVVYKVACKRGLFGRIVEDDVTPSEWQPLCSDTHDSSKLRQSLQKAIAFWPRVVLVKVSERCQRRDTTSMQQIFTSLSVQRRQSKTWPGARNGDAFGNAERRASKSLAGTALET